MEAALGGVLDAAPDIHTVRDVAPNKRMLCISFRLPSRIAYASDEANGRLNDERQEHTAEVLLQTQDDENRPAKRLKAENTKTSGQSRPEQSPTAAGELLTEHSVLSSVL